MDTSGIKRTLSDFIQRSLKSTTTYGLRDGTAVNFSKSIYEIQHHLRAELERSNINTHLDSRIISNSILNSFNRKDLIPHKPHQYAFPFLKFIYHHFSVEKELLTYIDDFINLHKEQLTWQDIVLTDTGATRCKTNIRFALNFLRDLHLIRSRNKNDKRTLMPTLIGQLIVHYMDWLPKGNKHAMKTGADLSYNSYIYFSGRLNTLKEPHIFTEFLELVKKQINLGSSDYSMIEKYLSGFRDIILSALTITEKGISYSSGIRDSDAYQTLLSSLNEESLLLPAKRG